MNLVKTIVTDSVQEAANFIRSGQIVAFPTETVYGLGANVFDSKAVRRIFEAKGRPADNPVIAHVASIADVARIAHSLPRSAELLMEAFFPGPLTIVLPKDAAVPDEVTAGLPTVGVRMPAHELARQLIETAQCPIAAPSANRSGRPSPTTWEAVAADLTGRIPCILKGEHTWVGLESTVVDCTQAVPLALRSGGISLEALRAVVPEIRLLAPSDGDRARHSPGTRHKHYAPRADVRLVAASADAPPHPSAAFIGLTAPPRSEGFGRFLVVSDVDSYARALFEFFRVCDAAGISTIYCEAVPDAGIGLAVMDRITRAADR